MCVVVDGARAFDSSANFTQRGQERNIEVGVLIADPSFASYLAGQCLHADRCGSCPGVPKVSHDSLDGPRLCNEGRPLPRGRDVATLGNSRNATGYHGDTMAWARWKRITASPSKKEVNVRAIPLLPLSGWRVYTIDEWPLIGAVPKGYLAYGDPERPDCVAYVAKKGRLAEGAFRECVTEEIISKLGAMLPIRMAKSKLVRLPVPKGHPADVRFLSRNFIRRGGEVLIHGIEIVGEYFNAKPEEVEAAFNLRDKRSEQDFYTTRNMVEVLKWFCRPGAELDGILDGFARMLAFDALVGAPDRHALNWGVVASLEDPTRPRRFAPLFDTARGMFREHSDQKLAEIAAEGRQGEHISNYAEKSRPIFGTGGAPQDGQRCNHFELVEHALRHLPDDLGHTMARFIRAIRLPQMEVMIQRRFRRVITALRMSFILGLLRCRYFRLKLLVDKTTT